MLRLQPARASAGERRPVRNRPFPCSTPTHATGALAWRGPMAGAAHLAPSSVVSRPRPVARGRKRPRSTHFPPCSPPSRPQSVAACRPNCRQNCRNRPLLQPPSPVAADPPAAARPSSGRAGPSTRPRPADGRCSFVPAIPSCTHRGRALRSCSCECPGPCSCPRSSADDRRDVRRSARLTGARSHHALATLSRGALPPGTTRVAAVSLHRGNRRTAVAVRPCSCADADASSMNTGMRPWRPRASDR